ncbi:sigma factor [Actinocorallia longicatena]
MAEQLFRDHATDLRAFFLRRVNDPRDADDLLQEVFLRAVRTPPAGANPAWLFTVARNVLTDHYRRPARETPSAALPEVPAADGEPDGLDAARAARCAVTLLGELPAAQAEALRRVDMHAAEQAHAARAAGVSVPGMKSRVQRGRASLFRLVNACCPIRTDRRGAIMEMGPCAGTRGC